MEAGLVEGFGRGSMNKGIRVSSLRLERFQVHRFLDLKVQMLWGSNFVLVWAVFGFQGPKFGRTSSVSSLLLVSILLNSPRSGVGHD